MGVGLTGLKKKPHFHGTVMGLDLSPMGVGLVGEGPVGIPMGLMGIPMGQLLLLLIKFNVHIEPLAMIDTCS
jgi:hypothetical protein